MPVSVTMPQLGESVTEGTVTRWLKDVGDSVAMDEPLLEVSTDKVDTEIPSPVAGVLLAIRAVEDDVIAVGGELAVIGDAGEDAPAEGAAAPAAEAPPAELPRPAEPQPPVSQAPPPAAAGGAPVPLPALGESVTEGTVTRWLKSVGDTVAADEPLLEVSTDKVDTEIPAPVSGTLAEILVREDETVPVGTSLGTIATTSAAPTAARPTAAPEPAAPVPPSPAPERSVPVAPAKPEPAAAPPPGAAAPPETAPAAYASPIVRKLAREGGVDLGSVTGTGAGGRITKTDVQSAPPGASRATPAPVIPAAGARGARSRTEQLSRLRRVIAERMVDSVHTSAQLTSVVEVDLTRVATLRERVKAEFTSREGVSLTYLPFFARAAVEALRTYPALNASIDLDAGTVTYHDAEHLGIAVDTERGLLVPVVREAGDLALAGLARRIADLAARTRTGKVTPDDLSGGTFTITNTGSRGALFDTPIVNQPQVAILGTGAVVKRPVVVTGPDGEDVIAIRSMAFFALTYDHRLVDGADAARFLAAIKHRLEDGNFESELGL